MKSIAIIAALAVVASADLRMFFSNQDLTTGYINTDPRGFVVSGDKKCQSQATQFFVSILSDYYTNGGDRVMAGQNIIRYIDGKLLGTLDTMFDPWFNVTVALANPILGKNGQDGIINSRVWTGTRTTGLASGDHCGGWRFQTNAVRGEFGDPTAQDQDWISFGSENCDYPNAGAQPARSIYCVEQSQVLCVFVTVATFNPSQGRAAADALCQQEYSKGLPTPITFKALLPDGASNTYDMLPGAEGSYLIINTKGKLVNTLKYDLFRSGLSYGNTILTRAGQVSTQPTIWTGNTNDRFPTPNAACRTPPLTSAICNTAAQTSLFGSFGNTGSCSFFSSDIGVGTTGSLTAYNYGGLMNNATADCSTSLPVICYQDSGATPASIHGDPHFRGFDGSKYNFDGQDGEIFNIVSDANIVVNAQLTEMEMYGTVGTWMTKVGVRAGSDSLVFDPKYGLLINNRQIVKSGAEVVLDNMRITLFWDQGSLEKAMIEASGYEVTIHPVEYSSEQVYLDVNVIIAQRPVAPHGVLGQTARYLAAGTQPKPVVSTAKNAEDFLDGTFVDYIVQDGIVGTSFKYSTFVGREVEGVKRDAVRVGADFIPVVFNPQDLHF